MQMINKQICIRKYDSLVKGYDVAVTMTYRIRANVRITSGG